MTRTVLLALAAATILAPEAASAQLPAPKLPATPTIETVNLRSVKLEVSRARYARAGTLPTEYRISRNPTFDDGSWQAFREGPTTKSVEGSTTWISGTVPLPSNSIPNQATGCPANTIRWRVFLQFRARNAARQLISSQVQGDSACVPIGG